MPAIAAIAVLAVTYNSANHIGRMLDSLPAAAAGQPLRVVVVDNGSSDATADIVARREDAMLVRAPGNLGYAGGINLARRHAGRCRAVLVLNPDLRLAPGAIAALARALETPGVGVAVPRIHNEDGSLERSLRREPSLPRALGDALVGARLSGRPGWLSEVVYDDDSYARRHSVDWATGAVALVGAECDAAVGPWDERFFLYSEEVDYAARARAAGFRIDFVPEAVAWHVAGGSGASPALVALMAVNRVRYVAKRGGRAGLFRAVVTIGELLRGSDAGHRAAVRALLRRSRWASLPAASPATREAAS